MNATMNELRRHAPFTALGAVGGVLLVWALSLGDGSRSLASHAFWTLHPLHVLLSAMVTSAMYVTQLSRRRDGHDDGRAKLRWSRLGRLLLVGYAGSIGIATLSDSVIPFAGEWLLDMPRRAVHVGFIEKWWLVNPLAVAGIAVGAIWPLTRVPHAAHVFISTAASVAHVAMAIGSPATASQLAPVVLFLCLSVWVPCCTSDIVFPAVAASVGGARPPRSARAVTPTSTPQPTWSDRVRRQRRRDIARPPGRHQFRSRARRRADAR